MFEAQNKACPKVVYNKQILYDFLDVVSQSAQKINKLHQDMHKVDKLTYQTQEYFQKYYDPNSFQTISRSKIFQRLQTKRFHQLNHKPKMRTEESPKFERVADFKRAQIMHFKSKSTLENQKIIQNEMKLMGSDKVLQNIFEEKMKQHRNQQSEPNLQRMSEKKLVDTEFYAKSLQRLKKNQELRQKRPFVYFIMNKILKEKLQNEGNSEDQIQVILEQNKQEQNLKKEVIIQQKIVTNQRNFLRERVRQWAEKLQNNKLNTQQSQQSQSVKDFDTFTIAQKPGKKVVDRFFEKVKLDINLIFNEEQAQSLRKILENSCNIQKIKLQ